jgi:hypothetical protein
MKNNIVVSYCRNKSFLDLVKISPDFNWVIYNKSEKTLNLDYKNCNEIMAKNIGRETDTYLRFIIDNYEDLPEYTIFIQDDIDNHIKNYEKFINQCKQLVSDKKKFHIFSCPWRKGGEPVCRTITNGRVELHTLPKNSIIDTCQSLNISIPKIYKTNTCAFLFCSKSCIQKREKSFYENALNFFHNKPISYGYAFEHIWQLIFR